LPHCSKPRCGSRWRFNAFHPSAIELGIPRPPVTHLSAETVSKPEAFAQFDKLKRAVHGITSWRKLVNPNGFYEGKNFIKRVEKDVVNPNGVYAGKNFIKRVEKDVENSTPTEFTKVRTLLSSYQASGERCRKLY
jgi:hypothetical protein